MKHLLCQDYMLSGLVNVFSQSGVAEQIKCRNLCAKPEYLPYFIIVERYQSLLCCFGFCSILVKTIKCRDGVVYLEMNQKKFQNIYILHQFFCCVRRETAHYCDIV